MRCNSLQSRSSICAARSTQYATLEPWNPYRRIPRALHAYGPGNVNAAAGNVRWKTVSKTATCATPGKISRAASIASRSSGLCAGARRFEFA